MNIYKLVDYKNNLERGLVLRCKGKYPYEEIVDFIITESYMEDKGYSLYIDSGYKAGLRFVILPKESIPTGDSGYAIDTNWLINSWDKWGYFDCPINEVLVVIKDLPNLGYVSD